MLQPFPQASCFASSCSEEVIESIPDVDCLLWAVGRRPLVQDIGLEAADVRLNPKTGYVQVDEFQNTTAEGEKKKS